jgi:hypothetical protein
MPRPTFADPKTDFAFKRIFGSEEHKDVLVAFLNDMLDLDEPHHIVTIELLPPEQRPPVAELKLSIVDVKCVDARGVAYVVEMQVFQVSSSICVAACCTVISIMARPPCHAGRPARQASDPASRGLAVLGPAARRGQDRRASRGPCQLA